MSITFTAVSAAVDMDSSTMGQLTYGLSSMDTMYTSDDEATSRLMFCDDSSNGLSYLESDWKPDFVGNFCSKEINAARSSVYPENGSSSSENRPSFYEKMAYSNGEPRFGFQAGSSYTSGVRYTKSSSGMDRSIRWDGSWNELRHWESDWQPDFVWNFGSKETNAALPNNSKVDHDGYFTKGLLDDSSDGLPDFVFLAIDDASCSPYGPESTEKIDAHALKERDQAAFKHVIKNLDACILEDDEQITSARDLAFSQKGFSPDDMLCFN